MIGQLARQRFYDPHMKAFTLTSDQAVVLANALFMLQLDQVRSRADILSAIRSGTTRLYGLPVEVKD